MAYMKLQAVVSSVLNQMHGQMMARERQVFLPRYNPLLLCGTEAGDQRGGEWEPIKISFEIQTVGLYPENHPNPQAF